VQILDIIDSSILFNKNYFYRSSVIKSLSDHFHEYATFLKNTYLPMDNESKLIEMGSNDGVLLQYLQDTPNLQAIGIDPSENVCALARKK
jgi:hypothetical protein